MVLPASGGAEARGGAVLRAELLDLVVEVDLVGRVLLDRREVERGQDVHVREAGIGERLEVVAPGGARQVEGRELAAVLGRHARVHDAEVAYVQLVEHDVLGRRERRLCERVPARGLRSASLRFTNWLRALSVARLTEYGSVTSFVTMEFRRVRVDLERDGVELAVPARLARDAPHAGSLVERHGLGRELGARRVVHVDADARILQRGGCPHGERGHARAVADAEGLAVGLSGVDRIEGARELHQRPRDRLVLALRPMAMSCPRARSFALATAVAGSAQALSPCSCLLKGRLRVGARGERDGLERPVMPCWPTLMEALGE